MSGAQGAQPPGSRTATGYSMAPGADTKNTKDSVDSTKDAGGVAIVSEGDNLKDAAGLGGPVFGKPDAEDAQPGKSPDLGLSGTA